MYFSISYSTGNKPEGELSQKFSLYLGEKHFSFKPKFQLINPFTKSAKGYPNILERKYGFTYFPEDEKYLMFYYGVQSGDSTDNPKMKIWSLPWNRTNRTRYDFINPFNNQLVFRMENELKRLDFDTIEYYQNSTPKMKIKFNDFDGEENVCSVYITEMEWQYGEGVFSFVKHLKKPIISRRIEMEFKKPVGRNKSDWKGGLIGTSFEIFPEETAFECFVRFSKQKDYAKYHTGTTYDFFNMEILNGKV